MKRIVTVQDISCLGKCSLTVALPVISAMGVECCVIPTAVLSTHTMFSRFTFKDLTEEIPAILDHWQEEEFRFDALYTGYLGSRQQVATMIDMFHRFRREDNFTLVDPVMGDNGRLYTGFDEEFAKQMADLCAVADIIVPNLTEAAYLLGVDYVPSGYDRAYIQMLLKKLTALGARCAVLTGVSFEEGRIGAMGYDRRTGEFFEYYNEKIPASYHGTGDLFASALLGGLTRGLSMEKALKVAADYVRACILYTSQHPCGIAYGACFEPLIPQLCKSLEKELEH